MRGVTIVPLMQAIYLFGCHLATNGPIQIIFFPLVLE